MDRRHIRPPNQRGKSNSPFSLWEKGWGRGVQLGRDTQALSPTLSQREREKESLLNPPNKTEEASEGSRRGHVGFVDVEVRVNLLHVVVVFHGFHQAQHLLGTTAFQLDVVLRDH